MLILLDSIHKLTSCSESGSFYHAKPLRMISWGVAALAAVKRVHSRLLRRILVGDTAAITIGDSQPITGAGKNLEHGI